MCYASVWIGDRRGRYSNYLKVHQTFPAMWQIVHHMNLATDVRSRMEAVQRQRVAACADQNEAQNLSQKYLEMP